VSGLIPGGDNRGLERDVGKLKSFLGKVHLRLGLAWVCCPTPKQGEVWESSDEDDDDDFYCSFRNKTSLAAVYLFGLGTLHNG
jgi:hypothetical protein